jgi:MoaA/NifB/PqqE/SkfB family radical SAM enzyme
VLRVVASSGCVPRCAACDACSHDGRAPSPEEILRLEGDDALLLGGGDATHYEGLDALLSQNRAADKPRRVVLEAPSRVLTPPVLADLARRGASGVLIHVEAFGDKLLTALGERDPREVAEDAERAGLDVELRLAVRPATFAIVYPAARALAPRVVWLELARGDLGKPPRPAPSGAIDKLLVALPNLRPSAHRARTRGYLPPCVLPKAWVSRPDSFRSLFGQQAAPNEAFAACGTCALRDGCGFADPAALDDDARRAQTPIGAGTIPWLRGRPETRPVPFDVVKRRASPPIVCTTPWTTLEVVDPDGKARQCCSAWTAGDRGNVREASLDAVWNGAGYQEARRIMSGDALASLCNPICNRLHDRAFAETAFKIVSGTEAFVKNQLVIAEDLAERRQVARGRPLELILCPSTYCNYDCIMCQHGRSPRRDLPDRVLDEAEALLPTLRSLTFLGGEPLANPRTMRFLRDFDVATLPDLRVDLVTNGSLLGERARAMLGRSPFGDVTISLNAGTPEVYERVQRGLRLDEILANVDGLLELRRSHPRWFGITLSFVLQPTAAHTLLDFARIADARGVRIRLMALNVEQAPELDFYGDPDRVAGVLSHVDALERFAADRRPEWLGEVRGARAALVAEAARRGAATARDGVRRLPVV